MTKKRGWIAAIAALVVLAAAVLVLLGPGAKKTAEAVAATDIEMESIASVTVTDAAGETFGFGVEQNEGDTQYHLLEGDLDDLSQYAVAVLFHQCSALEANDLLPEADEAEDYGFSTPQSTVVTTLHDGATATLVVGDAAPAGAQSYVLHQESGQVYLVREAAVQVLSMRLANYRKVRLTPLWKNPAAQIEAVTLESYGVWDTFEVVRRQPDWLSPAGFEMKQPYTGFVDTQRLQQWLFSSLAALNSNATIVEDAAEDFAPYGLDAPKLTIEVTDESGTTIIDIGHYDEEAYMMARGTATVVTAPSSTIGFFARDAFTMLDKPLFAGDFSALHLEMEGRAQQLEKTEQGLTVSGKALSEEGAGAIETALAAVQLEGPATEEGREEPAARLLLANETGEEALYTFHEVSPRQWAVKLDGDPTGTLVQKRTLDDVMNALEEAAA